MTPQGVGTTPEYSWKFNDRFKQVRVFSAVSDGKMAETEDAPKGTTLHTLVARLKGLAARSHW